MIIPPFVLSVFNDIEGSLNVALLYNNGFFYYNVYEIKLKTHSNYYGDGIGFVWGLMEEFRNSRIFLNNKIVDIE